MTTAGGFIKSIESGSKHLVIKRFTLRYPEQKLKFVGDGYQFDPKRGVGIAGYRGRHILMHDKCTGCQLCAIACEGIAEAIGMVKVDEQWKQNKKGIMPQIDYGKCVFCGFCVDCKLSWCVNEMLLCKGGQLIVICHKQSIKGACINTKATEYAFTIVNLRHYAFFVLFPLLVYLNHSNCFCYSFTCYSTELTTCTFIME